MTHWGWYWNVKKKHIAKKLCSNLRSIDSFKIQKPKLIVTDTIFFEVGNIDDAISFYESIKFILNFRIPKLRGVSSYRGASFYVAIDLFL